RLPVILPALHHRAAPRVQAQPHVVHAVKKRVELRAEYRRMVVVADTAEQDQTFHNSGDLLDRQSSRARDTFAPDLSQLLVGPWGTCQIAESEDVRIAVH